MEKADIEQNEKNKPMTDEERIQLAAKLDRELDDFMNGLEKRKYTEGWPEDRWQEEMEKHPFFMKNAPKPGAEVSPLVEGLQKLKYDPEENTPEELAISYKEDGNYNFKYKNYRLAIMGYTEGIKIKCGNPDIEAALYNNRSAAHYFIENYRSSLSDCKIALKLKPNYTKTIIRAANCCFKIDNFDECIQYCDEILLNDPENQEILSLRNKAEMTKKAAERDKRKKEIAEKKKKTEENKLILEIINRGIKIENFNGERQLKLSQLEPTCPEIAQSRVFLDENQNLVWPVMYLYPEYKTMDFIQQFNENVVFQDHLQVMFEELPVWDEERKYSLQNINVYFEDFVKKKVYKVDFNQKLGDVLKNDKFLVRAGTPSFLILAKNSLAEKNFLDSYS